MLYSHPLKLADEAMPPIIRLCPDLVMGSVQETGGPTIAIHRLRSLPQPVRMSRLMNLDPSLASVVHDVGCHEGLFGILAPPDFN